MNQRRRQSSVGKWILAVLVVVLLVWGGWWAGRATLVSELDESANAGQGEAIWGTAQETSVGRTVPVSVTVRQPTVLTASNHLGGVVTSTNPGSREQGDVLYTVGDTPVRVIQSAEPFWRELSQGARGSDVEALQQALVDLGHLKGPVDGRFGAATGRAVRAWQKSLGIRETGQVPLGEIVAVPGVPAQVSLGEAVAPSKVLSGGEDAVFATSAEHDFRLIVNSLQAQIIPVDATVNVRYEDHEWVGVIRDIEEDPGGNIHMILTAAGGGSVCGDECGILPPGEEVSVLAHVVVTPPVSGVGVPTAAIETDSHGHAWVTTRDGRVAVTVVGAGQGATIVEGLDAGTEVRIGQSARVQTGEPSAPAPEHENTEEQAPEDEAPAG